MPLNWFVAASAGDAATTAAIGISVIAARALMTARRRERRREVATSLGRVVFMAPTDLMRVESSTPRPFSPGHCAERRSVRVARA